MKDRTRAERRHHTGVKKKKWKKVLIDKAKCFGSDTKTKDEIIKEASDPVEIGRMESTHGAMCSCHMCGNPRKYFKEKTVQEKRSDQDLKDED